MPNGLKDLKLILESITGFEKKIAYRAFPENKAPKLPFICYLETGTDNFFADNKVYKSITVVDIELYSRNRDLDSEKLIEDKLDENLIPWDREVIYLESEKCYETVYTVEV